MTTPKLVAGIVAITATAAIGALLFTHDRAPKADSSASAAPIGSNEGGIVQRVPGQSGVTNSGAPAAAPGGPVARDFQTEIANLFRQADSPQKRSAIEGLLREWSRTAPEAALAFILAQDFALDDRRFYLNTALSVWTLASPDDAWAWVLRTQINGRISPDLVTVVISTLTNAGRFETAAGLLRDSPEVANGPLIRDLSGAWAAVDANAAAAWARGLPTRIMTANADLGLAASLAREDLEAAKNRAITLPDTREAAAAAVAVSEVIGLGGNHAAEAEWLNSLPVTNDSRYSDAITFHFLRLSISRTPGPIENAQVAAELLMRLAPEGRAFPAKMYVRAASPTMPAEAQKIADAFLAP